MNAGKSLLPSPLFLKNIVQSVRKSMKKMEKSKKNEKNQYQTKKNRMEF